MDKAAPSMLKATLIGGGAAGVAAAIPGVNYLNCLCCALVIGGGFLAAFLYSRDCGAAGSEFRPGNGALVGLVAGLFYSISATIVGVILRPFLPEPDIAEIIDLLEQAEFDPAAIDTAIEWIELFLSPIGIIFAFFLTLLVAAVFSTIGGLIGGAVFKVEPAPPTPSTMGQVPPPPGSPPQV